MLRASLDAGDVRKLKALQTIEPRFLDSAILSIAAIPLSSVTNVSQGNLVPVSLTLQQVQWYLGIRP
jgi:hypothetical protein